MNKLGATATAVAITMAAGTAAIWQSTKASTASW
jgi:hypothetical protein